MPIKWVMPSNYLVLCCPLLLLPLVPLSIRVFSNESTLRIRWTKYWSFSFNICLSNEHSGLIEESKLLHFVRFREKSLWKSPDLTPPPANQSEPLASQGNSSQARERRTNQNSTPNPSPEGDQSDPETPVFLIFRAIIPYISNVTQSSGLLPIAAALVLVGAPA